MAEDNTCTIRMYLLLSLQSKTCNLQPMLIGINASAALKENPTGVEEYIFQLIKHLAVIPESRIHRFVLYLNSRLKSGRLKDMERLPDNFKIKFLFFPFAWTQIRLAWEMKNAKLDVLFIPVHILPFIHPKKSIAVIHGLEYEYFPELYPFWHRMYLRWSTKYALKNAFKIIAVSKNTKRDLVKIYGGKAQKISVIYHGVGKKYVPVIRNQELGSRNYAPKKCILYLGRLELKKNILGIIEAYNELRKKNPQISNKLILAGAKSFGYEKITEAIGASAFKNDIILKGYVSEEERNILLENSAIFLFPSFYEGFGLPVLEAQSAGVPVVASNTSCLPEIAGKSALLIDPKNSTEIAQAMEKILGSEELRRNLIQAGLENIKRFSWEKCARETLKILTE